MMELREGLASMDGNPVTPLQQHALLAHKREGVMCTLGHAEDVLQKLFRCYHDAPMTLLHSGLAATTWHYFVIFQSVGLGEAAVCKRNCVSVSMQRAYLSS